MNITFKGKRILVTGAAQGIGYGIVKRLTEYGGEVVALDKDATLLDKLAAEVPGIHTIAVDLMDWNATQDALKGVAAVDCLVNNAGICCRQPFLEITADAIDKSFSVNVKAIINVSQVIVKGMIQNGKKGTIVNVSSAASKAAVKGSLVYCGTKSAVDAITKVMALELGKHQIRVNSVNPIAVMTELGKEAYSDAAKREATLARIPLGRFAEVDEVVDAVMYLLSERSSMVNGTALPIEGGALA